MFYDGRFPPNLPPEPIYKNDNEYDFAWRGPVNNLKPLDVIFTCEERWSRFVRQLAKVDLPMRRMIHYEDAETVFV